MIHRYGGTEVETAAESEEEFSLLLGVTRDLSDPEPKWVYSDWLQDRDDPRGAFLHEFLKQAEKPDGVLPSSEAFPLAWRLSTGIRCVEVFRQAIKVGYLPVEQGQIIERIFLRHALPTVWLIPTPTPDDQLPPGSTKFGGLPDMLPGQNWGEYDGPRQGDFVDVFCAQLRLTDFRGTLVGEQLPAQGLLSFWQSRVGFYPDQDSWQRPIPPAGGRRRFDSPRYYPLPSARLRLVEGMDIPVYREALFGEFSDLVDSDLQVDLICDFLKGLDFTNATPHQILGHGAYMNADTPEETPGVLRFATFASRYDLAGFYWGDSGRPFYFITKEDLAAARFDRVLLRNG